jgi:hypothetical protein
MLRYRDNGAPVLGGLMTRTVSAMDRVLRVALSSDQKKRLAQMFPWLRVRWETSLTALNAIDWSATKAYCSEVLASPANIWINVKGRQPQGIVDPGGEYREVVDFLAERLAALKDPVTGLPLVRHVLRKDEVYHGPYLDQAPDLMLAWWEGDGFSARTSLPKHRDQPVVAEAAPVAERAEWSGTHRLEGVLAVRGAGVKVGAQVTGARIIDLAPTILHMLGEPVPDDMDGRVLTDIFDPEHLMRRPVGYQTAMPASESEESATYSPEEGEMIRKRLQDLGYLE